MDKQSVINHIKALEQKHHEQDESLDILMQRPQPQNWLVNTIKRRKLKIKTEIEHLKQLHGIGDL
jgi:hypothetical protein